MQTQITIQSRLNSINEIALDIDNLRNNAASLMAGSYENQKRHLELTNRFADVATGIVNTMPEWAFWAGEVVGYDIQDNLIAVNKDLARQNEHVLEITKAFKDLNDELEGYAIAGDINNEKIKEYEALYLKFGGTQEEIDKLRAYYLDLANGQVDDLTGGTTDLGEAGKDAWKKQQEAVKKYLDMLVDLQELVRESDFNFLGDRAKIEAEGQQALAAIDKIEHDMFLAGQKAYGKDFELTEKQEEQLRHLRINAKKKTSEDLKRFDEKQLKEQEEFRKESWLIDEKHFNDIKKHREDLFIFEQEIQKNKFMSVKRSEEEIAEFENEQQKKLINFQVQQLRELQTFYEQNADKGLFGPLIEQTEAQINALLSELNRVTDDPNIKKKTKSIGEKIFNDLLGFDLTDAQVQQAAEIIGKAYDTLTASIASGIDENIAKIEEHISAIDEDIAAAENAVAEQQRLQEEGSASNVRTEQERLNKLTAERDQYLAEREEQVRKEKQLEATMAAVKGAIAIANIWAAESSKGTAGIILAAIETAAILAAIGAAFSDSSSAVSGWYREGTAQVLGGQSHEGGGVSLGSFGEAEKGEFLGILSAKKTKKYGKAMMSLFDGLNSANSNKTMDGLIGLAGTDILSTSGGTTEIALKEHKEIKGIYDHIKKDSKKTTYEDNKRIERSGGHTRIIYN